jgi:hypothetical protein
VRCPRAALPWGCGRRARKSNQPSLWRKLASQLHVRASSIAGRQATSRTNSGPLEGPPMCRLELRDVRREAATVHQGP